MSLGIPAHSICPVNQWSCTPQYTPVCVIHLVVFMTLDQPCVPHICSYGHTSPACPICSYGHVTTLPLLSYMSCCDHVHFHIPNMVSVPLWPCRSPIHPLMAHKQLHAPFTLFHLCGLARPCVDGPDLPRDMYT